MENVIETKASSTADFARRSKDKWLKELRVGNFPLLQSHQAIQGRIERIMKESALMPSCRLQAFFISTGAW
jgi:hypothetical protein